MKVPSRDTRIAVQYVSRLTGRTTVDVASKGAGLSAASVMMANLTDNGHGNPTYIRVAVIDEATETCRTIVCDFCGKGTGIRAFTIRPAADRHGNEYYACAGCRSRKGLTEIA